MTLHWFKRPVWAVLLASAGLGAMSTAQAGGFFFLLPLGLFSGKGDTCVSSTAKVGETINKPDGTLVSIKALSGTSTRCSTSEYPILAEVETMGKLPANETQGHIDIPDGWVQDTVTESMKSAGVVMFAKNKTFDAGLQLGTWKRSGLTSTADFVASRKAAQVNKLKDAEQFETQELTVGGLPAWRYEVRGHVPPSGMAIHYVATFVQGEREVVGLLGWTTSAGFAQTRGKLVAIADSITGIGQPRTETLVRASEPVVQTTIAPEPGPAPAAMRGDEVKTSAQRLRELNGLLQDGLITRSEYDAKKRQLLDAL